VTEAVVTGASGLLGGAVLRELARDGGVVEGWSHRVAQAPDGIRFRRLELRSAEAVNVALRAASPALVVHCAALTDVDACEADPDGARLLNAEVPGRLAAAARALGARFVHISTDAVYDGERAGPHAEDEPPGPVNAYARSKLAGERAVLDADPGALILRTTMHGWTAQGRLSFSEAIARALLHGRRLTLFADVRFSPLDVTDLARLIGRLAAHPAAAGVLNAGAADAVSKEEFGRLVARELGLDPAPVEPIALTDAGLRAPRPRNTALAVERITELLGAAPPTVEAGVRRLREELESGAAARLKGRAPGTLAGLFEDA
jgi:dTDP-4-dehydrorhamnose reductase